LKNDRCEETGHAAKHPGLIREALGKSGVDHVNSGLAKGGGLPTFTAWRT
jgi:hypothetical protein